MKCSKCGKDNPQGKNVCTQCGAFLYSANPQNRVPLTAKQKSERRKMIAKTSLKGCFWGVAIVIIAFIAIAILSFLFVRFVMPQDMLDEMADPNLTETVTQEDDTDFFEPPQDDD